MHLDQPLDQRQPDAQAAGGPLDAPVHLGEHVEDVGQRLGRDADPVVADGDDDVLVPAARRSSQIRPPCSVYLALLVSRLLNTWASRVRSASR